MGKKLFRCRDRSGKVLWVLDSEGGPVQLETGAESLGALLLERDNWKLGSEIRWNELSLECPVTSPTQIICLGKNYLSHVKETGVRPEDKNFNMFFTKAPGSLVGPNGPVVRPKGVTLLDYEIELGLVIGQEVKSAKSFSENDLWPTIIGLVIANDISARDIQIPQKQWFKGKSYRTFCPVGPFIYLWDPAEQNQVRELELELRVDGKVRQKAQVKQMIYSIPETLKELSGLTDLFPGDLILTGTPGGVAMRVSTKNLWQELMGLRSTEQQKFAEFLHAQQQSDRYLQDGQMVECSIRTPTGTLDLGQQRWTVVPGSG
jgi:2,4-didehydro-3-deoxy-L-rhamnonate hydrolase